MSIFPCTAFKSNGKFRFAAGNINIDAYQYPAGTPRDIECIGFIVVVAGRKCAPGGFYVARYVGASYLVVWIKVSP